MGSGKHLVQTVGALLCAVFLSPAQPPVGGTGPRNEGNAAIPPRIALGRLATGAEATGFQAAGGAWGIEIGGPGLARMRQSQPIEIDLFYEDAVRPGRHTAGYETIRRTEQGFIGQAEISHRQGVIFAVEDRWTIAGNTLLMDRSVRVTGHGPEGFITAFVMETDHSAGFSEPQYFIPGAAYGTAEYMAERAPAGPSSYRVGSMELREDALTAPLFGLRFADGTSVAVMDRNPRGNTTSADGVTSDKEQISEEFRFGAFGGRELPDKRLEFGYWYPGSEGRMRAASGNGAQRRRYHPIRDGFSQEYNLALRFGEKETYHEFYRASWRWSWDLLKPAIQFYDIEAVRRSLVDMLADRVYTRTDGKAGIPWGIDATNGAMRSTIDYRAVLGFCGRNLQGALFLLEEGEKDATARGERLRKLGTSIVDSFLKLRMSPPEAEGFNLITGAPEVMMTFYQVARLREPDAAIEERVFLRSLTDDMTSLLRAYKREQRRGSAHAEWVRWSKEFADWLLPQQQAGGGFPRSWRPLSGEALSLAPESSYNAVPFLVLLSEVTGDPRYRTAAMRAAEYCWDRNQSRDRFVGGTIDNVNIIDKEAATLSIDAYLTLYEATRERRWLDRAAAAADNAETYMYIWNVPMPEDADNASLHWKKGVPTIGLSSTTASGPGTGDQYMAYVVTDYARLYKYTHDEHYFDVARVALHATKSMLAIPGRTYDLLGPGWQQEHWSMSGHRGYGGHRMWLPWVSTSHLAGILDTEEFDPELFRRIASGNAN
jgi:hypothetical protein